LTAKSGGVRLELAIIRKVMNHINLIEA